MANIPCLKAENHCTPCAGDSSNPFANLSIEPFDLNIWLNVYFGSVTNVIPNAWQRDTCVGFCESSLSQIDADDCARRRALECIPEPPLPPIPPQPPIPLPPQQPVFCNQEMTCQSGTQCYTLPACTVFSHSQADANAVAASICEVRANDPSLSSPCSGSGGGGSGGGGGGGGGSPGQIVTYEMAWNNTPGEVDTPRGAWFEGNPCPWPDDYASTWIGGNPASPSICLCNGNNADPYQWPFGQGSPSDPDSIVTQMDNVIDAVLDSFVLPNTASYENVSTLERLYLRTRIEGGITGKHVAMQAHWQKPGGAWTERYFNFDTFMFEDAPAQSRLVLSLKYDPCLCFQAFGIPAAAPQINTASSTAESGDVTFEFNIPPGAIYYACVRFESKTHSNGPSMLDLVTTVTDL